MPNNLNFRALSDSELEKSVGKLKTFNADLPKKVIAPAELRSKLKDFQGSVKSADEAVKFNKINAVKLRSGDVSKLRAINESTTPTAEAIVGQKTSPDEVLGILFSSLSTLEFSKIESEFKTRTAAATTAAAKAKVNEEWLSVVKGGQQAFAAAGLGAMKETDLRKFSQELVVNKANFNAVVKISNSGVVSGITPPILKASTVLKAGFLAETGVLKDIGVVTTTISNLCSVPFAQGSFTRHFAKSFALRVSIPYWCPTWTNPLRICHKTVTLAGVNFSVDVNVGYRVTCCGATAWGQAGAQACGTLVGITFCAGCTATINGVAGIGRSGSGSSCIYGIGINAQLRCTFGGLTILNLQAPFGFNVTGPCPPAGLCN